MRTLLLVTMILALSGCTAMMLGNTSSRESASSTSASSSSAADSAISGEIRRQLSEDNGLSQYAIGIRTRSGKVTLSGTVGSYPLRDRAVSIAGGTAGVSEVDNRIIVNTNL
ncbi:MAG: BON domain-containing protein [Woeseiaceae bacterium]